MRLKARVLSRLTNWACWPFVGAITGIENMPQTGPCILAANHISVFDGPLLCSIMNLRSRHAHFVSYKYSFDHPFTGLFLKVNQGIVLDESTSEGKAAALRECRRFLDEGRVVGLFPEAHTAPFEAMRKAKSGIALLALQTGAPVMPIGLVNTHHVVPRKGELPGRRWKAAEVRFGQPLDLSPYVERFNSAERRESLDIVVGVSTIIMRSIAALSGQNYPHGGRAFEKLKALVAGEAS